MVLIRNLWPISMKCYAFVNYRFQSKTTTRCLYFCWKALITSSWASPQCIWMALIPSTLPSAYDDTNRWYICIRNNDRLKSRLNTSDTTNHNHLSHDLLSCYCCLCHTLKTSVGRLLAMNMSKYLSFFFLLN